MFSEKSFIAFVSFWIGISIGWLSLFYLNKALPIEPTLRHGDQVLIMQGFYAGEKAHIGSRRKLGDEFLYELFGDGDVAIDSSTWFRQSEFILNDKYKFQ